MHLNTQNKIFEYSSKSEPITDTEGNIEPKKKVLLAETPYGLLQKRIKEKNPFDYNLRDWIDIQDRIKPPPKI